MEGMPYHATWPTFTNKPTADAYTECIRNKRGKGTYACMLPIAHGALQDMPSYGIWAQPVDLIFYTQDIISPWTITCLRGV